MTDTAETIEGFAARALGMKRREIIGVAKVADGLVVTTHDGQRTLIDATGAVVGPWTGEEIPAPPVTDDEPEPAPVKYAEPKTKGRAR